jgi:hypothetical protein
MAELRASLIARADYAAWGKATPLHVLERRFGATGISASNVSQRVQITQFWDDRRGIRWISGCCRACCASRFGRAGSILLIGPDPYC